MRSSQSLVHANLRVGLRPAKACVWCASAIAAAMLTAALSAQVLPAGGGGLSVDNPRGSAADEPVPDAVTGLVQKDMRMGTAYLAGNGVPRDPAQAANWFRKAADLGSPEAQNEMGYLYIWGLGVNKDDTQAFRWFARAAGSGWQQAKLNIAVMYMRGMGVARDPAFARQVLEDLAARMNARAEDYLGVMYLNGDGVTADTRTAEEWFSRSAKGKNPEGEFAMGQLYSTADGHKHDFGKAAKFLRDSAKAGYVPAMYTLGVLLVHHPEVDRKGQDEAMALLERAAEAGTWQSSATLGLLASQGQGTPRDMSAAFRWFTIAARQGGAVAEAKVQGSLAQCAAELTADQQKQELAAAGDWMEQHPHTDLFVFDGIRTQAPVGEVYAMRASTAE